ncbi:MAG: dephospho-CoA kinase [Oscillospiraceae bacterium]|jgi:dephospho-CoA kinase|nr:dephospho-CoA kinase [Oscillospiraceae bacterium]
MTLGFTGGSGAGKSTALRILEEEFNGAVIDCDAIYRGLLEENEDLKHEIAFTFPDCIVKGKVDRRVLASQVFTDENKLVRLNKITHKYVAFEAESLLAIQDGLAAIDAIALLESGLKDLCDKVIVVTAPYEMRIARIMVRDELTEEEAKQRINAQFDETYYTQRADYVLRNEGTQEEFEMKCRNLFSGIVQ